MEAHVAGARQPLRRMAVEAHLFNPGPHTFPQPVAERRHPRGLVGHVAGADLDGLAQAHDPRDVLGARAPTPLVLTAVLDRRHLRGLPDIQPRYALRAVDLVAGEGQEVYPPGIHVHRHLAERLDAVHMQGDARFARDAADLPDRLERADLRVGAHERHEDGVGPQGLPDVTGIDHAEAVHGQIGRGESLPFERLHRPQHRVMLDLRGDDVPRALGGGNALDSEIVRLGAARGEDDLILGDLEEARDLLARRLHAIARFAAEAVDARRIAEVLAEVRQHGLEHLGVHRGGCVVIEIDPAVH